MDQKYKGMNKIKRSRKMEISLLLNEIKASSRYENQIVHIEEIPARDALYTHLLSWKSR